jgi:hypothetical protein
MGKTDFFPSVTACMYHQKTGVGTNQIPGAVPDMDPGKFCGTAQQPRILLGMYV